MLTFSHKHPSQENANIDLSKSFEKVISDQTLGFHQLSKRDLMWQELEKASSDLSGFQALLVLGIGGSALGARVIVEALLEKAKRMQVFIWDNVDPIKIERDYKELNKIGWDKVAVVAISKSGNTLETLSLIDFLANRIGTEKLFKNFWVCTENKPSPLFDLAKKNNLKYMELAKDVGGRFSVLSPAGMFVAAFMGLSLNGFRQGADQALADKAQIISFAETLLGSFKRSEFLTVFWGYSEVLKTFGFWAQQLWSESLSKKQDRKGGAGPRVSYFLPCVGVTDQHSLLQQFAEGVKSHFLIFFRNLEIEKKGDLFKNSQTNLDFLSGKNTGSLLTFEYMGTQKSLEQNGISQITMTMDQLNEQSLGYLFMYFQLLVATIGESLDINTFNQPGVETGKVLTLELMRK